MASAGTIAGSEGTEYQYQCQSINIVLPSASPAAPAPEAAKTLKAPEARDGRLLADAAKQYMLAVNLYTQQSPQTRDDPQTFQLKQIEKLDKFMTDGGSDWRFQMGPKGTPLLLPYKVSKPILATNMLKMEKAVSAAYNRHELLMKGFDKRAATAIRMAQRKGDYSVTKETERQKVLAEMNQVLEKREVSDVHFEFVANYPRPFLMPGEAPSWTDGDPRIAANN